MANSWICATLLLAAASVGHAAIHPYNKEYFYAGEKLLLSGQICLLKILLSTTAWHALMNSISAVQLVAGNLSEEDFVSRSIKMDATSSTVTSSHILIEFFALGSSRKPGGVHSQGCHSHKCGQVKAVHRGPQVSNKAFQSLPLQTA